MPETRYHCHPSPAATESQKRTASRHTRRLRRVYCISARQTILINQPICPVHREIVVSNGSGSGRTTYCQRVKVSVCSTSLSFTVSTDTVKLVTPAGTEILPVLLL